MAALRAVNKTLTPEVRVFNNAAADVMKVAELALEGKIALARGDKQAGIDLLNKAIAAEDATYYAEPADWDLPVREVLGGVLLCMAITRLRKRSFVMRFCDGRATDARCSDLPRVCESRARKAPRKSVQGEFEKAWQHADTKLDGRIARGPYGHCNQFSC